jgi:peptide/nickel transport system ATP-binding protein
MQTPIPSPHPLLEVHGLTVTLDMPTGPAQAVRGVDFSLHRGGTLGIVGESGCGKSLTALSLMGLQPAGMRLGGSIRLDGRELVGADEGALCALRGDRIAMIFQEPMTALNPLQTVGIQVSEPLRLHRGLSRRAALDEARALFDRVGLARVAARPDLFPHQLSGGQRQRVMIAMALACRPDLLIADEPTTALDVTIQGQILDLILDLVDETGMALILISHDLGVIAETVDRVLVMYGGMVVEESDVADLFRHRAHPYTQGLFAAMPRRSRSDPDRSLGLTRRRLHTIPGTVPGIAELPPGCPFFDRCRLGIDACTDASPAQYPVAPGHGAACIRLDEAAAEAEGERP